MIERPAKIFIYLFIAFSLIFSMRLQPEARRLGSANRQHKYLYRIGTPGNYRYVYPKKMRTRRSSSVRCRFLTSLGHDDCKAPQGYEVDHIIPLCAGGQDLPSNMQLLDKEGHKLKTRVDLKSCR